MKECTKCRTLKKLTEFNKHKTNKDGLQYRCRDCCRILSKEWHKNNPTNARKLNFKRNFGITIEQYEQMHVSQSGLCAICFKPETATVKGKRKALAVDHCHKTGKIRGLLCRYCNLALGYLRDNPELCDNAKRYLCQTK